MCMYLGMCRNVQMCACDSVYYVLVCAHMGTSVHVCCVLACAHMGMSTDRCALVSMCIFARVIYVHVCCTRVCSVHLLVHVWARTRSCSRHEDTEKADKSHKLRSQDCLLLIKSALIAVLCGINQASLSHSQAGSSCREALGAGTARADVSLPRIQDAFNVGQAGELGGAQRWHPAGVGMRGGPQGRRAPVLPQ